MIQGWPHFRGTLDTGMASFQEGLNTGMAYIVTGGFEAFLLTLIEKSRLFIGITVKISSHFQFSMSSIIHALRVLFV